MLTLMPTFKSGAVHPENDAVVELATLFKENNVHFSLLFSHQMPDLRRLLYRVGLENFPWVSVYDDVQQIRIKAGIPFTIHDLVLPEGLTPLFMDRDVYYFNGTKRVMQVHFHDEGFVYWIKRTLSDGKKVFEQFDDRGFISTRTVTGQDGSITKYWLNDYGHTILIQSEKGIEIASDQRNRFSAPHYDNMQEIIYEFLMKQSMRIEQSLRVITSLNTDMLELRNGQPLLKQMIFLVNQRLNLSDKDRMMINPKDIFIFPTSADQQLFVRNFEAKEGKAKVSKIPKYVIPQYATTLDLGISNETALDLIYWRLGNIQDDEGRRLFQKFLNMLQHQDDQSIVIEGTEKQVEAFEHQMITFASDTFDVDLKSKDYKEVANFIADQRSGKPIAGLNERAKKLRALPNWQQLSAAEFVVSRVHLQVVKPEVQEETMHQARVYIDTETIPDLRLMILAISNGVPLVVRQASTLVHDHQNGIVIQELTEVFSACQFFLQTLRRWNNSLIVNSQLIDEFSAERLIQRWKEVMTLGKAQ